MKNVLVFVVMLTAVALPAEQVAAPRFAVTFNALETASFIAANRLFLAKQEPDLIFLPFHFDGHMRVSDKMGVSFGFVYRFESYQDKGPLYSESSAVRMKKVWTNYHEIFLLAGPRFSFVETGLDGFYFSMKGGIGTAFSPVYVNLSLLAQPEIGYAFSFGQPGFRLELGLGILANLPFYETLDFAVPWKTNRTNFNMLGFVVHQAIPIVNVGVGVAF